MRVLWFLLGAVALAASPMAVAAGELAEPVQLMAGSEPIDIGGIGYAAPFMSDYDGDGVRDLWVGQFKDGKLRVYPNQGTNTEPQFKDYVWFKDGADTGRVPSG